MALTAAVRYSVNPVDMLGGAIALLVQLLVFAVVRLFVPNIANALPAGKVSVGVFLGALSLGCGLLNAACITN